MRAILHPLDLAHMPRLPPLDFAAGESTSGLVRVDVVTTIPLPPLDPDNPDLMVFNHGQAQVWLQLAADAPAGPDVAGCAVIPPMHPVLITGDPDVVAAMRQHPRVISGAHAENARTETAASVRGGCPWPTKIDFTRGTATPVRSPEQAQ